MISVPISAQNGQVEKSRGEKENVFLLLFLVRAVSIQIRNIAGGSNNDFFKIRVTYDGQGGLACCNSWDRKESDTTERLN